MAFEVSSHQPHCLPKMKSDFTEKYCRWQMGRGGGKQMQELVWIEVMGNQIPRRIFSDNFRQLQFKDPYVTHFTSEWQKKKMKWPQVFKKLWQEWQGTTTWSSLQLPHCPAGTVNPLLLGIRNAILRGFNLHRPKWSWDPKPSFENHHYLSQK